MSAKFPRRGGGGAGPFLARSLLVVSCEWVNSMCLRPIWFFSSIFHQAQINGQWKRIRRWQLVLAHIPDHESIENPSNVKKIRSGMEFNDKRPYLVLIIYVPNY